LRKTERSCLFLRFKVNLVQFLLFEFLLTYHLIDGFDTLTLGGHRVSGTPPVRRLCLIFTFHFLKDLKLGSIRIITIHNATIIISSCSIVVLVLIQIGD
jgi:hypothetical protein